MAGMANFIETLLALNQLGRPGAAAPILPQGGAPPVLPPALPALPLPAPNPVSAPRPPLALMEQFAPAGPAPVAAQPVDRSIIDRYTALAGTAPTPPAINQPGLLEKLSTVLLGVGAGLQGQGPQFVESVRERRERPRREFEQRQRQFEERRAELGLRGTEAAMLKAERSRERTERQAERAFERELDARARELQVVTEEGKERLRNQLAAEREIADDERAAAEQRRRERAQQEKDARTFTAQLGRGPGAAPPRIAEELGSYYAGLKDSLSPAASKFLNAQARRAEIFARRAAAGGTGGSGGDANARPMAAIVGPNGENLGVIPYNQIKFNRIGEPLGFPPGAQVRIQNAPAQQQAGQQQQTPSIMRAGFNPAQGLGELSAGAGPQVQFDLNQPQQSAPASQRQALRAQLLQQGFSGADADAALDKRGIR